MIMFFRFGYVFVATLAVAGTTCGSSPTFVRPIRSSTNKQIFLQIRGGGGGGIPEHYLPVTMGKIGTILAASQGILMRANPTKSHEVSGMDPADNTQAAQFMSQLAGTTLIQYSILLYGVFFQNTSIAKVAVAAHVVWVFECLNWILGGHVRRGGMDPSVIAGGALVDAGLAYALTTENATIWVKAMSVWWAWAGLPLVLPGLTQPVAIHLWKIDQHQWNKAVHLNLKTLAVTLLASVALMSSQVVWNATRAQALGWTSVVWGLFHFGGLLDGSFRDFGIKVGNMVFGGCLDLLVIAITLIEFGKNDASSAGDAPP